eukprot:gb/GECG01013830.1/.p1 GENE.gb/GECG01013830.1/~~gb/GECG01013830.1/.p1  ORF type:complete len:1624 (+),score=205.04 gb/GECG01013830.1/:1-4872(+)
MTFLRQTGLLLKKNYILKKRSLVGSICEISMPLILVLLLVIIYTVIDEDEVDTQQFLLEEQDDGTVELDENNDYVAPFAFTPYRLRRMNAHIALVPGTSDVGTDVLEDFRDKMDEMYPGINVTTRDLGIPDSLLPSEIPERIDVPKFSEIAQIYDSQSALESRITSNDYADSPGDEIVFAAIAFNHGKPDWDYSIRMNLTATPSTVENVDVLQQDVEPSRQEDYLRAQSPFSDVDGAPLVLRTRLPGFLTLQRMVDRYIINQNVSEDQLGDSFYTKLFEEELGRTLFGISDLNIPLNPTPEAEDGIRQFLKGERYSPQTVRMAPFPIVGLTTNIFYTVAANAFPLFLLISFLPPTSSLIRGLVLEKEHKIREGMQMMGLSTSALYSSWFITYLLIYFVIAILISLVSSATFFSHSNFSAVLLLFLLFGASTTAFCFMISVFFSRAKTASTIGVLLYFGGYFPFFAVEGVDHGVGEKTAASLLSPAAFALSIGVLSEFEDRGQGVRFGETANLEFRNYSYSIGVAMMFVDMLIYLLIAWYFDAVWPKEFGVRRPPHFFLTPDYWREVCGCQRKSSGVAAEEMTDTNDIARNNPYVEPIDGSTLAKEQANKAIRIKDLRKEFESGDELKVAVDDLSLNIHEGELFVLLGHNGAGKTTTISMLTGLMAQTSGKMHIYNEDVSEDLSAIRKYLGVCPQHDVLWEQLTVKEHLQLYAGLKGVDRKSVDEAVNKIIKEVGLTEKVNVKSCNLSGGQKRKLSVAIALLGDSKVVILDEPTSGMDPYSRRSTWDIIQNARKNRIILLTTHFMDEADLLGDRISILAHGKLKCYGSSMFLKKKYGVGYLLTCVKASSNYTLGNVVSMVKEYIPEAEVNSEVGTELSIRLPLHSSDQFPTILAKLDRNLHDFGLETYGLSATTLEEVFLRVAHNDDPLQSTMPKSIRKVAPEENGELEAKEWAQQENDDSSASSHLSAREGEGFLSGADRQNASESRGISIEEVRAHARKISEDSFWRHFMALFLKRFHYYKRDAKAACFQLVVPILAVLFGLLLIRAGEPDNFPSYQMSSAKLNIQPNGDILKNRVPYTTFEWNGAEDFNSFSRFNSIIDDIPSRNATPIPYDLSDASNQEDTFDFFRSVSNASQSLFQYRPLVNFTTHLLNSRNAFEASKYGAYSPIVEGIDTDMVPVGDALEYLVQQNSTAFHACPIFMNLLNSAAAGSDSITTRNHPLPFTGRQQTIISGVGSFFAALIIVLAFAFIPASYAIFIVKEREIAAKHQQLISGVSIWAYWISTFVWDFSSYMLPMFGSIAMIAAFDVREFVSQDQSRLAALFLLFLFYGSSVSGFTYCISFFFKKYSAAQNFVLFVNMISMILVLASFIMAQLSSTCEADEALRYIYLFLPGYALGMGLVDLSFLSVLRILNQCEDDASAQDDSGGDSGAFDVPGPLSALNSEATLDNIVYMAVLSVVYFGLAVAIDYVLARPDWLAKLQPTPKPSNERPLDEHEIDPDVKRESERCDEQGSLYSASDDVILLQHLRKIYSGGKVAVRDISFGVPAGEVFGFLGINGAGKTSTLVSKITTGIAESCSPHDDYAENAHRRYIAYVWACTLGRLRHCIRSKPVTNTSRLLPPV